MKGKSSYIEKEWVELQILGYCLKAAVFELPDSVIKQYLLLEITKPIKLKSVISLYRVQTKIVNIIDIIVLEKLENSRDVLRLLKDIERVLQAIIVYIKNQIENQNGQ